MEDGKLTWNRFCQLSEDNRTQYTWVYGELLASKKESKFSYHLYEVDGFYVELVYNKNLQQIVSIDPLLKTEELLKYLEEVKVDELL